MGAFATSQIIFIKENGVGTALAVLIDASIIRALLVPSLMELALQVELDGRRRLFAVSTAGSGSTRRRCQNRNQRKPD